MERRATELNISIQKNNHQYNENLVPKLCMETNEDVKSMVESEKR